MIVKAKDDWQAQEDFRALARAEEIQANKARLARAKRAGRKIVEQEQKALNVKQRVVGGRRRGKKR